jgi:hypothetical protein
MVNIFTHFCNRILSYILVPIIIIVGIISYNRFIIERNYIVEYEGVCDPFLEECFIGHEDDEYENEYYYSYVHKYAYDLYKQCGKDITDCQSANMCLPEDKDCYIDYCDVDIDGYICENLQEELNIESNNNSESLKDDYKDNTNI